MCKCISSDKKILAMKWGYQEFATMWYKLLFVSSDCCDASGIFYQMRCHLKFPPFFFTRSHFHTFYKICNIIKCLVNYLLLNVVYVVYTLMHSKQIYY